MLKNTTQDDKIVLLAYQVGRIMARNTSYTQSIHLELTMLQLRTLMLLMNTQLPMNAIAKELKIKLPTASLLIGRLFDMGMVERVQDKNDRRIVYTKITTKGKKAYVTSLESRMKRMRFFLKKITKEDKDALFQILTRVFKKINKEEK